VYEELSPKSTLDDERPAQARRRRAAQEIVAGARDRWPELAGEALQTVCANSVAGGLHRHAEQHGCDVIVVGSSHRSALGRVWPGSATDRTLHGAPCAVAVAPPGYARRDARLRRIGVGFDGSPEARVAVREAERLAAAAHATLVLVSVVDVNVMLPVAFDWVSYVQELHGIAGAQLAAAADSVAEDVEVEQCKIEGRAVEELTDLKPELDLLVLGSRGYGPVRRVMLGGVSSRVVRRASCPVLVLTRSAPSAASSEDGVPAVTSTPGST
jgi:nucleotide-binding universal stress UspA family protein